MLVNNFNHIFMGPNVALEYERYKHQILFDAHEKIIESYDHIINDTLIILEKNEYYYHLEYNQQIMYNFFHNNDYSYLHNYLIWRYRLYYTRGIDLQFLKLENKNIKSVILYYLKSISTVEVTKLYDYLDEYHEEYVKQAKNVRKKPLESIVATMYNNLLAKDELAFRESIKPHLSSLSDFCDFFTNSVSLVIRHIGDEWALNSITVAQENIMTNIIKKVLLDCLQNYSTSERRDEKVLITTAPDESHSFGTEIGSKILKLLGYDVVQISSKVTQKEIDNAVYEFRPDYVLLTVTLPTNLYVVSEIIRKLKTLDVEKLPKLYVAGNAIEYLSNPYETLACDYYFVSFSDFFEKFS